MKELFKKISNGFSTFVTVVFVILMILYAAKRFVGTDLPDWPKEAIYMSNDSGSLLFVYTYIENKQRIFYIVFYNGQEYKYKGKVLSYNSELYTGKTYMTLRTIDANFMHVGKDEEVALVFKDDTHVTMQGFWGEATVEYSPPPDVPGIVTPVEF